MRIIIVGLNAALLQPRCCQWVTLSVVYTLFKGVLLCMLSLTHLVCCGLVVMVTFDNLCSIQYKQCLTHQVC